MGLFAGHSFKRSPLSLSVPLDGSDTVRGLRTLERETLLNSDAVHPAAEQRHARPVAAGRRHYQRYKGPFIEQLTLEDLQAEPKPWRAFLGSSTSYNVPASVAVLMERMEENLVAYLPNYLRLALLVLMLVLYLRPIALLGTAAVAVTIYVNTKSVLEREQAAAQAAAGARSSSGGSGTAQRTQQQAAGGTDQKPLIGLSTLATWLIVAYTRCLPIILLALLLSMLLVLVHSCTREARSESKHRGRAPLGYSLLQVLGRQAPQQPSADTRLVFKELWWLWRGWSGRKARQALGRLRFVVQEVRDLIRFRGSAK